MARLTDVEREKAKGKLTNQLEEAIGQSPSGLTEEELDSCWKEAKDYWNTRKEQP